MIDILVILFVIMIFVLLSNLKDNDKIEPCEKSHLWENIADGRLNCKRCGIKI